MRGIEQDEEGMFSYISTEKRVPLYHPLRSIKQIVRNVFNRMHHDFDGIYSSVGRPSIPPEQLLCALLLQAFYGIRSHRQLCEQLDYNLLFRWFVGLSADSPIFDHSSFSTNQDRLERHDVFGKFMAALLHHDDVLPLLSDEHFSVDGTLIEAWASHKSFKPKDGSGDGDGGKYHKHKRSNHTASKHQRP